MKMAKAVEIRCWVEMKFLVIIRIEKGVIIDWERPMRIRIMASW